MWWLVVAWCSTLLVTRKTVGVDAWDAVVMCLTRIGFRVVVARSFARWVVVTWSTAMLSRIALNIWLDAWCTAWGFAHSLLRWVHRRLARSAALIIWLDAWGTALSLLRW